MFSYSELAKAISYGGSNLLADAGLKATVVLLVAAIAVRVLNRASAAVRHRIWSLGLCGALVLPMLSLAVPPMRLAVLPASTMPTEMNREVNAPLVSAVTDNNNPKQREGTGLASQTPRAGADVQGQPLSTNEIAATTPAEYSHATRAPRAADRSADWFTSSALIIRARIALFGLWMAGLILMLARLIAGFWMNWMLLQKSRRLRDGGWMRLVADLSTRIGLTREVASFESSEPVVPMTWGLLRPTVLVPVGWRGWSEECKRCVLLHELAHVKRLDVAYQIIGRLVVGLHWFNPLAWYAVRQLRIECELACDDCVLASGSGRRPMLGSCCKLRSCTVHGICPSESQWPGQPGWISEYSESLIKLARDFQ